MARTLAKTVKATVEDAVKPIRQELNNLATAVRVQEMVANGKPVISAAFAA